MSSRDLVNAIAAGDAMEIETAFNAAMSEKISTRLDDKRIEVARNLFSSDKIEQQPEVTTEEQ